MFSINYLTQQIVRTKNLFHSGDWPAYTRNATLKFTYLKQGCIKDNELLEGLKNSVWGWMLKVIRGIYIEKKTEFKKLSYIDANIFWKLAAVRGFQKDNSIICF